MTARHTRVDETEPPSPRLAWAFLLDVDGTLVDIGITPAHVQVASSARAIIDGLYEASGGAVALVTGRALSDFDYLYPECTLPLSGQHGVEWRNVDGVATDPLVQVERLDPAREILSRGVEGHPDLLVEDKGFSIALHYRRAPGLASFCHRLMRSVQSVMGDEYGLQRGKCVIELKPAAANKGRAVHGLMSVAPLSGRRPVFAGDDITDEDAFAVVNAMDGVSIRIGPGSSTARWRMRDTSDLLRWLATAR